MAVSRFTRVIAAITASLIVVTAAGLVYESYFRRSDCPASSATVGGPFELMAHSGKSVSERDYRGRLMLVFFGYTFCPDVCPIELQNMSAALDQLDATQRAAIAPLFITIDPTRDTVAVMKEYVANFHPDLVGLTGTAAQIAAAAKAYRAHFGAGKKDEAGDYLMDHSSFIYLMGRDGKYRKHFRPNSAPEAIADQIRQCLA